MAIAEEVFVSRLLGKTVVDPRGKKIGKLADVLVNEEELPRVVGFVLREPGGKTVLVDWAEVHIGREGALHKVYKMSISARADAQKRLKGRASFFSFFCGRKVKFPSRNPYGVFFLVAYLFPGAL